jgi:hypothetical protein
VERFEPLYRNRLLPLNSKVAYSRSSISGIVSSGRKYISGRKPMSGRKPRSGRFSVRFDSVHTGKNDSAFSELLPVSGSFTRVFSFRLSKFYRTACGYLVEILWREEARIFNEDGTYL